MIKKLHLTWLFFFVSLNCLAITIINQSTMPVAFRIYDDNYLRVIDLKPGATFELVEALESLLFLSHVGHSGVLRFHMQSGEESFFRTDTGARVLFKLEAPGKIRPISSYKTMIIKDADPEIYDGLSIELQKTIGQQVYDFFDFSDMKCSVQ